MKLIKNIFIKLIWLILILLVAFNIYNFVSINVLKKDIASINGYAVLEVVSGSMEPTIKVGDIIIINTKNSDYKAGDIITFYDVNGSFVTHRLVNIGDGKMITKGDANDSEDEEMDSKNIVGKYVTKINGGGKLMASLKNPFVMLLIMVIGIVLCLLMSTDENLIPKDLTDEEKAYLEYKKYYGKKQDKKKDKKKQVKEIKEETPEIVMEEAEVIGEIIYVSVEELEEQMRTSQILREQLKEELRKELKEELRREIQQENKTKHKHKNKKKNNNQNHNNNKNTNNNNNQQNNNKKKKHHHRKNHNKVNNNKNQTRK